MKSRLYRLMATGLRGQSMTEYALILSAIAVVAFGTYQLMGKDISSLLNTIITYLTPAAT